jgi:hypothetical protein
MYVLTAGNIKTASFWDVICLENVSSGFLINVSNLPDCTMIHFTIPHFSEYICILLVNYQNFWEKINQIEYLVGPYISKLYQINYLEAKKALIFTDYSCTHAYVSVLIDI